MARNIKITGIAVIALVALYAFGAAFDFFGRTRDSGTIIGTSPRTAQSVTARIDNQANAAARIGGDTKQILFGDLHVHTTNSTDAFLWSLPIYGGEGSHPLADACDYARFCSALDFWAITDHAEASTPKRWSDAKESIRACNAVSQDDMVSFIGFEWTQVGATPATHYGHKNVIFRDLEDEKLSKRPIASGGVSTNALRTRGKSLVPLALPLLDPANRQDYYDIRRFLDEAANVPLCDATISADKLPASCFEIAETPGTLIKSLEEQKVDPLVIPHGTTWGFYTPAGVEFDKHLKADQRPDAFPLVEIMSGHGNSEEYRDFRAVTLQADGTYACPAPTKDYLPMCHRAGEIVKARCLDNGEDANTCTARAKEARYLAAQSSVAAHLSVPGTKIEEWLDAGQCKDCFLPSFGYRPGNSVQYGLAIRNFDDPDNTTRLNWGFIAASDNHRARPGTGYKEVDRLRNTEAVHLSETWRKRTYPKGEVADEALELDPEVVASLGFRATEMERQASFWTTGGLAAVHSEGRSREEIFAAMERRETYGTSGARILLWFNTNDGVMMGSTTQRTQSPNFEVKAVGAYKQKEGCPDQAQDVLGAERIQKLCANECFNPSNERLKISRIEIVRIRPQVSRNENVADLIDDNWLTHECDTNSNGCSFSFTDPEFSSSGRMATYYARAIQEPTEKINADNLRCTYDKDGNCISLNICYGDDRTPASDDCVGMVEERAWSSPIYVEYGSN